MQSALKLNPTEQAYDELQRAYDFLNARLFGGQLPSCLITLQRNKRTMGFSGVKTDEIAINPEYFAIVPIEEVLATVVHEMVHLWQDHFGTPGRGKYHNQEWADKMISIGLIPSSTGAPGGRQTGDQMADYPAEGGVFLKACRELLKKDFKISWYDRFPAMMPTASVNLASNDQFSNNDSQGSGSIPALVNANLSLVSRAIDNSNRMKYKCNECAAQVWGKPALNIVCGDCSCTMNTA
jgi:predicted SprT family Zn-dependent metalloprotease